MWGVLANRQLVRRDDSSKWKGENGSLVEKGRAVAWSRGFQCSGRVQGGK